MPAAEFFTLPTDDAARENVLKDDEVLAAITLPAPRAGTRSTYHKVLDREAWTHAVVSAAVVLEMDDGRLPQRARSCSAASRRFRGGCRRSRSCWPASAITPELAAKAGEAAVAGARPLAKNGYKVPMTRAMVARTISSVADASACRVERRDFLFLRAGQPAVLSCEPLFMRFLDSQMDGTHRAAVRQSRRRSAQGQRACG